MYAAVPGSDRRELGRWRRRDFSSGLPELAFGYHGHGVTIRQVVKETAIA
jgi:hypothetical protein